MRRLGGIRWVLAGILVVAASHTADAVGAARSGFGTVPSGPVFFVQHKKSGVAKAWLGVRVKKAGSGGAQVISVSSKSPAEGAGIRIGDVITEIHRVVTRRSKEGKPETITYPQVIRSGKELIRTLSSFRPEERAMINILRAGKPTFVMVVLKSFTRRAAPKPPRSTAKPVKPAKTLPPPPRVNNPDDLPDLPKID